MGTHLNLYAEILSPDTNRWVAVERFTTETGGGGWMPLLGLTTADTPTGEPFPSIATPGYPDDLDEATIEEMVSRFDLEPYGSGHFPADDISFCRFTLADWHAAADSEAEFTTRRGATKASTMASIKDLINEVTEHCDTFFIRYENIRFIAAVSP